jgi:hypothetical protein
VIPRRRTQIVCPCFMRQSPSKATMPQAVTFLREDAVSIDTMVVTAQHVPSCI